MTKIHHGGSIKNHEKDGYDVKVSGLGVLFDTHDGERDLELEYFTKDTYFGHRKGDMSEAMMHHGIPLIPEWAKDWVAPGAYKVAQDLSRMKFSNPVRTALEEKGMGIIAEIILDGRKDYEAMIAELIGEHKCLDWSSGAMPGTEKDEKTGEIRKWVIGEFSFTHRPAEPRAKISVAKSFTRETFDPGVIGKILGVDIKVPAEEEIDPMTRLKMKRMELARTFMV